MKRNKATFGTISHGTLRAADLVDAFAAELEWLRGALPREIARDVRKMNAGTLPDDAAAELVDTLQDALQEFAPAYAYFGAHCGDGSDFGFWLSESFQEDFDGLQVSDTSEVPKDYRGEVLHVNDHGNATLYVATSRGLREVWSVV